MPAGGITIYAKWAEPTYNGTVHLTIDGSGANTGLTIGFGATISEADMPTVVDADGNIVFQGNGENTVKLPKDVDWIDWATKNGTQYTAFQFAKRIFDDITLYPYYVSKTKYTVTYDVNGGSGEVTDSKNYASGSYADIQSGDGVTAPEGKTFLYWNTDKGGKGVSYYPGDKLLVNDNATLYAVYGDPAQTISLTYNTNYPEGSSQTDTKKLQSVNGSETLQNNASFKALTVADAAFAVPDGYYFKGWNTAADGSGTSVAAGADILVDADGTNKLYAQWEKKKEVVLTVTGNNISRPYDGKEHSVTGYTTAITVDRTPATALPGKLKLDESKAKIKAASGTNANKYDIGLAEGDFSITGSDREKYSVTIQVTDGWLTIQPRTVTLTSGSGSKEYDGTPLERPQVQVEGSIITTNGKTQISNIRATGSVTGVTTDPVPNTIAYDTSEDFIPENYVITKKEGTLTVTKNASAKIVFTAKDAAKIYDGTPLTEAGVKVEGLPDGFTAQAKAGGSITNVSQTREGNNPVSSYKILDKEGKDVTGWFANITKNAGTLTIKAREITLTSADATKVYDETPLVKEEVTVGGTDGLADTHTIEYTFTGSQTYVGSSPNTFTYLIKDKEGNVIPASETKVSRKSLLRKSGQVEPEGNYRIKVVYGTLTVTDDVEPEKVVTKTHEEKVYQLGEQIVFEIRVTNIYDTAQTVTLTEQDGVVFTGPDTFTDVQPGATVTTSACHVVNEDDLKEGTYTNTVKAEFKEVKKTWEGTDEEDQFAHLTLAKEVTNAPADETAYMNGETIRYQITVTNDGTAELYSLKIADILTGDEWNNIQSLDPGEELTFDTSYKVTDHDAENGFVTNQAVGNAQDANGNFVEPQPVSVRVPVQKAKPSLYLEKTSDKDKAVELGETIHYTIRVVNNGNTAVSDIVVTDEMTGDSWNAGTLKPGEDKIFHTEYVVTEKDILAGSVKNIALADGKDPNGDKPDVTPGEKEDKTVPDNSHLTVTKKTVSSPKNRSGYAAGETIRYRIEAVNDGNLTLTEVEVTDPLTGETWKVEKLAPGEKQTFETKYTVTEKDQSVGKVVNEATAKGKTPGSTELIVVPGKTSDPVLPKAAAAVTVSNTVQTGDPTQTGAYLAMLFVAAAGIGILAKKKKKERRK